MGALRKHKGCKKAKHAYRLSMQTGGLERNPVNSKYDLYWRTSTYTCTKCGSKKNETEYRRRFSVQWWSEKYSALVNEPYQYE